MTSNIGSDMILAHQGEVEALREPLLRELRTHFRPEFLNRIDETLIFHALTRDEIGRIVSIQLDRLAKRLRDQNVTLEVTDEAKSVIGDAGYDPAFGARPLKRAIIRMVENPVSKMLLAGEISGGATLVIDAVNNELAFSVKPGEQA